MLSYIAPLIEFHWLSVARRKHIPYPPELDDIIQEFFKTKEAKELGITTKAELVRRIFLVIEERYHHLDPSKRQFTERKDPKQADVTEEIFERIKKVKDSKAGKELGLVEASDIFVPIIRNILAETKTLKYDHLTHLLDIKIEDLQINPKNNR